MFAYCLNNPVNHSDKSGIYADDYAGWGGLQIAIWIYELFTGNDHPHHQTEALEREVIETQTEIITDTVTEVASAAWDNYMFSYEQSVENTTRQAQATIDIVADRISCST